MLDRKSLFVPAGNVKITTKWVLLVLFRSMKYLERALVTRNNLISMWVLSRRNMTMLEKSTLSVI